MASEQTISATPAPTWPLTITMIEMIKAAKFSAHPIIPSPGMGAIKSAQANIRHVHPALTGDLCESTKAGLPL